MLDHAARRVSIAHSWIKNAETKRASFEEDARRIGDVPPAAVRWLEDYCRRRGGESGSVEAYRIRKRAIDGWDAVVKKWSRSDCITVDDRITAARALQDDPEIDKFGDIQLFEALADEEATSVWKQNGAAAEKPLKDFVFATDAIAKKLRFKVPAYRHPDPLRHPVFCDFGKSRWSICFGIHEQFKESAKKRRGKNTPMLPRSLCMGLWDGARINHDIPLVWSSKRLSADLGLTVDAVGEPVPVSRGDRLGRAVANAAANSAITIIGLFEQKDWNGRLQGPRRQLDDLAAYLEKRAGQWDDKARGMRDRIRWLITFSAALQPQGPWINYAKRFSEDAAAKPFVSRKGDYAVKHHDNQNRNGHAKLILSRLAGLRILAVDLGHRFAAACAVWETLSSTDFRAEVRGCKTLAGGSGPNDLFLQTQHCVDDRKSRKTVYRRIGPDALPNGSEHPAPWAKLVRQFLIKMQGEDKPARKASRDEIETAEDFENRVGRERLSDEHRRSLAVDELMAEAVRTVRLALQRHGRRASIAHNLTATHRIRPGARLEPLNDETRLELLVQTLADWHALATDERWNDPEARTTWNEHLSSLPNGFAVERHKRSDSDESEAAVDHRKEEATLLKRIKPLAETLASHKELCSALHQQWAERWNRDDILWHSDLKWLGRWIRPRGKKRRSAGHRHVGGLSLKRISTMQEFRRRIQVGYFNRLHPDGSKVEVGGKFGQKTLDALERLKENRVKQLASRIVEAALGVGIERRSINGWDVQRPRRPIQDPRFAPCHAVVIEDLTHYRPDETRTRRENRATMDWKSAATRKYLEDACQLYGLHLRDVNPRYTSLQDSRSGAPGVRCVEVRIMDFLSNPFWRKQRIQAKRKAKVKRGNSRDQYLLALESKWSAAPEEEKNRAKLLRIPLKGGDIFVRAESRSPTNGGIQADLNAAANIGLRALMDPDFPGKWWYVPCDPESRRPKADKVKGSILEKVGPLQTVASVTGDKRPKSGRTSRTRDKKDVVNLWRDPQSAAIQGADGGETWHETPAYWNIVQERVVRMLRG